MERRKASSSVARALLAAAGGSQAPTAVSSFRRPAKTLETIRADLLGESFPLERADISASSSPRDCRMTRWDSRRKVGTSCWRCCCTDVHHTALRTRHRHSKDATSSTRRRRPFRGRGYARSTFPALTTSAVATTRSSSAGASETCPHTSHVRLPKSLGWSHTGHFHRAPSTIRHLPSCS